jgi:hypothetical protein
MGTLTELRTTEKIWISLQGKTLFTGLVNSNILSASSAGVNQVCMTSKIQLRVCDVIERTNLSHTGSNYVRTGSCSPRITKESFTSRSFAPRKVPKISTGLWEFFIPTVDQLGQPAVHSAFRMNIFRHLSFRSTIAASQLLLWILVSSMDACKAFVGPRAVIFLSRGCLPTKKENCISQSSSFLPCNIEAGDDFVNPELSFPRRRFLLSCIVTLASGVLSFEQVAQAIPRVTVDEFAIILRDSPLSVSVVEFSGRDRTVCLVPSTRKPLQHLTVISLCFDPNRPQK